MAGNDAFIWFVATTVTVFAILTIGTFFAVQSYEERKRARVHLHMPHLMPHRVGRHRH